MTKIPITWTQYSKVAYYGRGTCLDIVFDTGEWWVMIFLKVFAGPFPTPEAAMNHVDSLSE